MSTGKPITRQQVVDALHTHGGRSFAQPFPKETNHLATEAANALVKAGLAEEPRLATGFYWVKVLEDAPWEVALYTGDRWLLTDARECKRSPHAVSFKPITPPEE